MGDRANVKMQYESGAEIYFYTHWSGSELLDTVREAMRRGKERWDDEPYLARIIFSEMTRGQERELTGYGIAPYICDGDDRVVTVNSSKQTVSYKDKTWSFEEFVTQSAATRVAG